MGDDGELVHATAARALPRPDQSKRCPALRPLDFTNHPAAEKFMRIHLLSYRIWRHYSFNPAGSLPLKMQNQRRYLGFGRQPFRLLCEASGLIGIDVGPLGYPCWPDRTAADLFLARGTRDKRP